MVARRTPLKVLQALQLQRPRTLSRSGFARLPGKKFTKLPDARENRSCRKANFTVKRVTGIGGIFFKSDDAAKRHQW
jgi:hypothetical protein